MQVDKEQLRVWKASYGQVFRVLLEGEVVYYRRLQVGEFLKYLGSGDISFIPKAVILNDVELKLAGSIERIANELLQEYQIEKESDIDDMVKEARERVGKNFIYTMVGKICLVFPAYSPDDLLKKPLRDLMDILAIAEEATGMPLYGKKPPAAAPTHAPQTRTGEKWEKPNKEDLMQSSSMALADLIEQQTGKRPRQFADRNEPVLKQ